MNVEAGSIYKKLDLYTEIADGVVNTASIFLNLALKRLGNDFGIVSMIIPKSFYSVQSWWKIRDLILRNTTLIAVNDVGKAFEKVGLEQGIVISSKKKTLDYSVKVLKDSELNNEIPQNYFLKNKIILTSATNEIFNIINKIESNSFTLDTIAEMPRGITENSSVYSELPGSNKIQVLGGTNIKQFRVTDGNKRKPNRYVKKTLASLRSKSHIFSKERICYQNLMSSLPKVVATIVNSNVPTDDTLNNLILLDSASKISYKYLLGILNSDLCTFYLKYRLLNCAILTVHLDKPYVGKLPIKLGTDSQICKLEDCVDALLNPANNSDDLNLWKALNSVIFEIYGIKESEKKYF